MNQIIAEKLADALMQGDNAYADMLGQYWNETGVDLCHEPPLPYDGVLDRAGMLQRRKAQGAGFKAAMPDFHHENLVVRVVGDVIYMLSEQVGTLADGTTIRAPLASRFTLKDGVIVKAALGIDMATVAPLQKALAAAQEPKATAAAT